MISDRSLVYNFVINIRKGGKYVKKVKNKRSAVVGLGNVFRSAKAAFNRLNEDRVTVFAAQSSYFSVISIIPFLMLILSLARILFPEFVDSVFIGIERELPDKFSSLLSTVYAELSERGSVSIVSISAVSMFWLSSRGVAAMTRGVAEVYGTRDRTTFISETLHSIVYTVIMVLTVILSLTVLVFGVFIRDQVVARFPNTAGIFDLIIRLRMAVFFVLLVCLFSLIFAEVSRTGRKNGIERHEVPSGFKAQLPGASVAAVGWMLYSFFYSLYIEYFPSASYIYGSLAAVILFMLWLYFCMIILLVGAEINKAILRAGGSGRGTDSKK